MPDKLGLLVDTTIPWGYRLIKDGLMLLPLTVKVYEALALQEIGTKDTVGYGITSVDIPPFVI